MTPAADEAARTWWDAARAGTLLLQRCTRCETLQQPPGPLCRSCGSPDDLDWTDGDGHGHVVAATRVHTTTYPHLKDALPYWVAVIALRDGARIVSNLVAVPDDTTLADGQCASLTFVQGPNGALPVFRLDPADCGARGGAGA
ncbi:Zn-ribbon domain-containing OB-fold protein [Rhizomonospora bruguierae]|uniref:Zn-ribbon domain-containing OB-fold protein n=1 Tax=Rhizomonospora bruguierae TaxID=1581705 RepID=UPI001BCB34B2|nr:zinc ribbon domain-containing protein [Micromonospora sp. NBRC 107566]